MGVQHCAGTRNKDIGSKEIINLPEGGTTGKHMQAYDDDIYCPTWLKSYRPQGEAETGGLSKKSHSIRRNKSVKRGIDLSHSWDKPEIRLAKKKDSPIKESFFQNSNETHFQKALEELVSSEKEYCLYLELSQSIFRHLIDQTEEYKNILSDEEKILFFHDLKVILDASKRFMAEFTDEMVRTSSFADKTSLDKFKNQANSENLFKNYNIVQLIRSCDVSQLNIGLVLQHLFDSTEYRVSILSCFAKYSLRMTTWRRKVSRGGLITEKWLRDADLLLCYKKKTTSMENLFFKPIERLKQYPLSIKKLADNCEVIRSNVRQHHLHVALIKINQIIEKGSNQPLLTSFEEVVKYDQHLSDVYSQNAPQIHISLENRISQNDDLRVENGETAKQKDASNVKQKATEWMKELLLHTKDSKSGAPREKSITLILQFKQKYKGLKLIQLEFINFGKKIVKFMESQARFAPLWESFLSCDSGIVNDKTYFIASVYSSYVEKMNSQLQHTKAFTQKLEAEVLAAMDLVMDCCENVKQQIQKHRKLKKDYILYIQECEQRRHMGHLLPKSGLKAHLCISLENQIKDKLPHLLESYSLFVHLILVRFNHIYLQWLRLLIGERSINDYRHLLSLDSTGSSHPHEDIIQMHLETLKMTKLALGPLSPSTLDLIYPNEPTI